MLSDQTIPLDDLASVHVTHGTLAPAPARDASSARTAARSSFEIKAASTINFPANNRAADEFLKAVTRR